MTERMKREFNRGNQQDERKAIITAMVAAAAFIAFIIVGTAVSWGQGVRESDLLQIPRTGPSYGSAEQPIHIVPMPMVREPIQPLPQPRNDWNSTLGMQRGWNPKPPANEWNGILGVD